MSASSPSRKPVTPTALFFQFWMLWIPIRVRKDDVASGGEKELFGERAAVIVGERVPNEIGSLRHRDEPDCFVERLRTDAATAQLRFAPDIVEWVFQILCGVGQQDFAAAGRIAGIAS